MKSKLLAQAALVSAILCTQMTVAQNTSPYWSLAGNSNASATTSKLGTTTNIPLRLFANNAEYLRIATDGKVGIGTTTPQQRLHVEGGTLLNIFVSTSALSATSGAGMIGYAKATPTAAGQRLGYFLLGSRGGAQNNYNAAGMAGYASGAWSGSSRPAYLTFETTPAGSTARVERVRIGANGNVGIGTTSPDFKLDVTGSGRFTSGLVIDDGNISVYNSSGTAAISSVGDNSSGYGVSASGYVGLSGSGTYGVIGSGGSYGVYGTGTYGVYGISSSGYGTSGVSTNSIGVYGSSANSYGMYGYSANSYGMYAYSATTYGIYGYSNGNIGGYFYCPTGNGLWAKTSSSAAGVYAGVFEGNVYASGAYLTSDKKLKKDVKDFTDALSLIGKLKPKHYAFIHEGKYASLALPQGSHYGFLAQDIEEVLPNLVDESQHPLDAPAAPQPGGQGLQTAKGETVSIKAINYIELIPIMVKGMQEQQGEITDLKDLVALQQKQINELKELVQQLAKDRNAITSLNSASLGQTTPNPANGTARIAYNVPSGARNARLLLTDNLGRTIRTMTLAGSGTIDIETASLSSGVYNYSLIIDGRKIETKKMTVAR